MVQLPVNALVVLCNSFEPNHFVVVRYWHAASFSVGGFAAHFEATVRVSCVEGFATCNSAAY